MQHAHDGGWVVAALLVILATAAASDARAADKPATTKPSDLISTQEGQFPIILSAPHGGALPIPGAPLRKGEGMTKGSAGFFTARDVGTEELAHDVAEAVEAKSGKKPYFVIARFERKYADPNRPPQIAYESAEAKPVYDAYRDTLAKYCHEVEKTYGRGLLLDVHGQGKAKDTIFRGTHNGQTVAHLIERFGKPAHDGPDSFFGLMDARGLKGFPLHGEPEEEGYNGGNIVVTYGGPDFKIDAIQLEFGGDFRAAAKRKEVAKKLADVVDAFAKKYILSAEKPAGKKS